MMNLLGWVFRMKFLSLNLSALWISKRSTAPQLWFSKFHRQKLRFVIAICWIAISRLWISFRLNLEARRWPPMQIPYDDLGQLSKFPTNSWNALQVSWSTLSPSPVLLQHSSTSELRLSPQSFFPLSQLSGRSPPPPFAADEYLKIILWLFPNFIKRLKSQ